MKKLLVLAVIAFMAIACYGQEKRLTTANQDLELWTKVEMKKSSVSLWHVTFFNDNNREGYYIRTAYDFEDMDENIPTNLYLGSNRDVALKTIAEIKRNANLAKGTVCVLGRDLVMIVLGKGKFQLVKNRSNVLLPLDVTTIETLEKGI